MRIPANGYQPDVLQKIAVQNLGTAAPGADISSVRAWVDDGDGLFRPALDRALGVLTFTGDRWQVTGLAEPVPVSGLHLFVTVDLNDFASGGRTVRFSIPTQPDVGAGDGELAVDDPRPGGAEHLPKLRLGPDASERAGARSDHGHRLAIDKIESAADQGKTLRSQIDHRRGKVDAPVKPGLHGVLVTRQHIGQVIRLQRPQMGRNRLAENALVLVLPHDHERQT